MPTREFVRFSRNIFATTIRQWRTCDDFPRINEDTIKIHILFVKCSSLLHCHSMCYGDEHMSVEISKTGVLWVNTTSAVTKSDYSIMVIKCIHDFDVNCYRNNIIFSYVICIPMNYIKVDFLHTLFTYILFRMYDTWNLICMCFLKFKCFSSMEKK